MKPAKNLGMVSGSFWGLLRGPAALPVLFASRQDAEENRDEDEYLVEMRVHPASAMALLRGRQELLRRREALQRSGPIATGKVGRNRGAIVDLSGYVDPMKCPKCERTREAERFVKLCQDNYGSLALRIAMHCTTCEPSWAIPFVSGLRFYNSMDLYGKPITWRQRSRRGLFGPPLKMEHMELRRMPELRRGRPVFRPQPRKARHKRPPPRPRVPVEQKRRRGSLTLVGAGMLRKALQEVAPKLKKEVDRAIAKSVRR